MKRFSASEAEREARRMTAQEFTSRFNPQIEVLDQENFSNVNAGNFNILFHGSEGKDLFISFFEGVLDQIYPR